MRWAQQFLDDGSEPRPFVSPGQARIGILPVPLEKSVSYLTGTAAAPAAIIEASRQVELFDPELDTSPYLRGIHTYPPVDCSGDGEEVLAAIRQGVSSISSSGQLPVCLGGEHTLTLAPVKELSRKHPELKILHLDAHADFRESYAGNRLSHACVMRRIYELGLASVSVGVRSLSEEEAQFISDNEIVLYPEWEFSGRGYPWEEIVDRLPGEIYITVDMDVFDPAQVPAVGTPEPGGLGWHDALALFRTIRASGHKVAGFDLVELCPKTDSVVSAFFAARLLYKMIGYFCRE
jgi:agmatinase